MIIEPQFPQAFTYLLQTIVARELQADLAKSRLDFSATKELFAQLDTSAEGWIFLEDLYIFLKKNGVSLNKKELKFINKYFGFSKCQKQSLQDFQRNFLKTKNQSNAATPKEQNQTKALLSLIKLVVEGNNQIEQARQEAAKEVDQLKNCLSKFYQDDVGTVTREILKQILSCLKLYSRLNSTLLCNYIIGEQGKDITVKQLFLFEGSLTTAQTSTPTHVPSPKSSTLPTSSDLKENKKLSLGVTQQTKPSIFKIKSESTDILLQIQNIQSAIKQKKQMYSQRKKQLQDESRSKPVGTLRKRPSVSDLKVQLQPQSQKPEQVQYIPQQRFLLRQERKEYESLESILNLQADNQNSKYSFVDTIEEQRDYGAKEVDQFIRSRMSSKNRDETLNKASSCARLKIQQIQRRVMGRVGQRAAASRMPDYVSRVPTDLRINSSQLRSRYSSLTRH